MHYAILCYASEGTHRSLSKQEDGAMMSQLSAVGTKLRAEGKLGPSARLMPTTAATTLRYGRDQMVLDGPFAETKEHLLGFYVIECASLDEAIDAARRLAVPRTDAGLVGALEIRPMMAYITGDET